MRGRRRGLLGALAVCVTALLATAAAAQATENLYWANYGGEPDSIAVSYLDGTGGGPLNLGGLELNSPEGMAYDTVSNRLFVTSKVSGGQILAIDLDGSGATTFTAPGAPIEVPEGIAVNPATRMIYWANDKPPWSIAWAKLDGSAGGTLNLAGTTLAGPCCRIAIDPVGGRVYWVNQGPEPHTIGYANLDNSGGGGTLNLIGSTVEPQGEGLAVDPAGGRIYFIGGEDEIGYANLNGSGGGNVNTGSAVRNSPWGLAFDPSVGRLYWGNEANAKEAVNAFGFADLTGTGGAISIATAPVAAPQDPLIIKSPAAVTAPALNRSKKSRAKLECTQGEWGADFPGSFVYRAPQTYTYSWTKDGKEFAGASSPTLIVKKAGRYACAVTAGNRAGSASQTSAKKLNVTAAKLKLTTKAKASARSGGLATFAVKAANQGDLKSSSKAKVCVKLAGAAKKALKAPKCKSLGGLVGGRKKTAKLKVKVLSSAAPGTYKLTFQVKGASGKSAKAKLVVSG